MRPQYLCLATLLAVGVGTSAWAQTPTVITLAATPDTVIARLMTFDRNGDGAVALSELPERMQALLSRGDTSKDGALDREEVRRLASAPSAQFPGLQGGSYGFSDPFGSDSSKRIDDALDDLRLAADIRGKASEIVRQFIAGADAKALDQMMASLELALSKEQLAQFQAAMKGRTVNVPAVMLNGVTIFGASPEETAAGQRVTVAMLEGPSANLQAVIERFDLDRYAKQQAVVAVRQYSAHVSGRVNETERVALLNEFGGLLTSEQRDDLRAALDRRPIVKLAGGKATFALLQDLQNRLPSGQTVQPAPAFQVQDLLLRLKQ